MKAGHVGEAKKSTLNHLCSTKSVRGNCSLSLRSSQALAAAGWTRVAQAVQPRGRRSSQGHPCRAPRAITHGGIPLANGPGFCLGAPSHFVGFTRRTLTAADQELRLHEADCIACLKMAAPFSCDAAASIFYSVTATTGDVTSWLAGGQGSCSIDCFTRVSLRF